MKIKILVTGAAGFIGFNFAIKLLKSTNYSVIGIDNFDNYYSIKLKKNRIKELKKFKSFIFHKLDIVNEKSYLTLSKYKFEYIFHFAAQAGVRYSVVNPEKYISTNILGTINLLNFVKNQKPKLTFFASSSSVYGDSKKFPLRESDNLNPKNIYAISKIINEISAKNYSKFYNLKIYGLRFFTIYGEWGRPDMLLFKILNCSVKNIKLNLNNNGKHYRDFTYINDVTKILFLLINKKIKKKFDIFNICSNNPQYIRKIVDIYKKNYGNLKVYKTEKNKLDVFKTHGDNQKIKKILNFKNFTKLDDGFYNTINWYKKNISKI